MIIKISTKSKTTLYFYDDTVYHTDHKNRTIELLPSKKTISIRRNVRAQVINDKGATLDIINRIMP